MCCTDKQTKEENVTIKNYNRTLQTQNDTMRSQKQKLENASRRLRQERDTLEIKLKEKEEKIESIEQPSTSFKISFHNQTNLNVKQIKERIFEVQQCKELSQLKLRQLNLVFQSIKSFFSGQFSDKREQIIYQFNYIYNLLNGEYFNMQKIVLSFKIFLKLIKQIITHGYNQKEDQQIILAKDFLLKNFNDVYKEIEQLIKLIKQNYIKEKSRILEESGIDENNDQLKIEINLQNKVTELQLIIQNLNIEKENALQENQRFQTITIPKLREQLHKKQAKQFGEIKDTLHKIYGKFIDKDHLLSELDQIKSEIKSIAYFSSNREITEIIKQKDLKISSLEKKLAQNQAKKLSEWSQQTELSNRKVDIEIHNKNRQIQDLKRSLNEQKGAFQEISSKMIIKDKQISDSFVIQDTLSTKEKQNIVLSSQLEKANQKIRNLQQQLSITQQNAKKQTAQIESQFAAKQRQLTESKARIKLLLDDNTTEKEKRAILSAKFTEKESQIQTLKEELGSISSEKQMLLIQVQQTLSLKLQVQKKNQELMMQVQEYKENQKAIIQKQATVPQKEILQDQNHIIALEKQFRIQKEQLQKAVDGLKMQNSSLTNAMEKMKRKFDLQLQQKEYAYSTLQVNYNKSQLSKFDLQTQIQKLRKDIKQLSIDVKQNQSLQVFRRDAIEQIQTLKTSLEKEKNRIVQLQKEIASLKELNMKMGQKMHQLSSSNESSRMRSASFVQHRTLFIGELLEKKKVQKKFLMSSIQTHMKLQIQKTNKLYEYKRDKNINPHSFIDGHSNLVLIIQTQKALIASYYSGELQSKTPMTSEALIFSLDNRKYYPLKNSQSENKTPKGMVYDQYYIIFGNAQVRIRSGEAKLFSNFGTLSGFFNPKGDKINALLGDGSNNEVDLINYEIHQIIFSENYIYQSL